MNIWNLRAVASLDFYKDISILELRLLYAKVERQLAKLDAYINANRNGPRVYARLRSKLRLRKVAVEAEIRTRLLKLSADG
jgi:hypothetical protein